MQYFHTMKFVSIAIATLFSLSLQAQYEDLQQRIKSFQDEMADQYKVVTVNVGGQDLGAIEDAGADFHVEFKFKGIEKQEDNIDRMVRYQAFVNVYHFDDEDDFNWAVKDWLKDFMNGQTIRPGRDARFLDRADPAIIVFDGTTISVITFPCLQFETYAFREWRKRMLTYFGSDQAIILEIAGCEGPAMWTKNRPNPKDRTWR